MDDDDDYPDDASGDDTRRDAIRWRVDDVTLPADGVPRMMGASFVLFAAALVSPAWCPVQRDTQLGGGMFHLAAGLFTVTVPPTILMKCALGGRIEREESAEALFCAAWYANPCLVAAWVATRRVTEGVGAAGRIIAAVLPAAALFFATMVILSEALTPNRTHLRSSPAYWLWLASIVAAILAVRAALRTVRV